MGLILALVRSDLRRRWRSWSVLVVVTGLVAGATIAAVAGWSRTNSAMDRFIEFNRPVNGYVSARADRTDLAAIDGVEVVAGGDYFLLVPVDDAGRSRPEHLGYVSPFSSDVPENFVSVDRPIIVSGRLADPSEELEVMVDEEMADLYDLSAGDSLTMQGYGVDQIEHLFENIGSLPPTGPTFEFTVTGIVRSPQDVVSYQRVPDVVYLGSAEVRLGPAFDAAHRNEDVPSLGALFGDGGAEGSTGYEIRVDFSRTTRQEVIAAVRALDPEAFVDFSGNDATRARREAERAIGLQATMLLALGALVGLGGAVLVAQGLRRQLELDRASQRSLAALGATRSGALGVAAVKGGLFALASVALAAGVAIALSPLTPVGHARRAEIDPGLSVDLRALAAGSVVLSLVLAGFILAVAWRESGAARRLDRRSRGRSVALADRVAQAGLPLPVVTGVRAARLGAGGGTVAVTVFVAAVGIVGALGFTASEHRLATSPDLWGWTFDAVVGDGNDPMVAERAEATLARSELVKSYAVRVELESVAMEANGRSTEVDVSALLNQRGAIEPRLLEGEPPRHADEVALGGATARGLGLSVGDEVELNAGDGPQRFTLSGLVVMHLGFNADRIGEGALLAPEGIVRLGEELEPTFVLIDYEDGVDPDEAYAALRADWGNTVLRPIRTVDVDQLHAVRMLPVWFSGLVGVVAVVTLALVLGLTIRRRRHDLALLRTLGFDSRQLRWTVRAQALTLVLPGVLLGAGLGVIAGRGVWTLTAQSMGAPVVPVVPAAAALAVVVGAGLLAWGVSAVPGRLAARAHPATILRTE